MQGKWKSWWTETESPQVFWPTYLIYLTMMAILVYYSSRFVSTVFWVLLWMLICSGILIPSIYLYKQRKK